ncbi:MAG: glycosyltransferase family 4 protein [Hungatella sp.]|nr:glycosyltransferase family 4 protein [Hungatella sp.]
MKLGIVELYCGSSGKKGFYNSQEIGLAKAMKKLGYDVYIFYPGRDISRPKEEPVEKQIQIIYTPAKVFGVHSKYDWNILLEYQIEIVQVGSDNQLFAPDVIHFCARNRIPVYCYIGTTASDSKNKVKRNLLNVLYQRNIRCYKRHKCFVKTPSVKTQMARQGIRNVEIAPVGLDLDIIPSIHKTKEKLRMELKIPENKAALLFVGRMDGYKRPLDAIELMNSLGEDFYLIMVGTGNLNRQVEEKIRSSPYKDNIRRISQMPNYEIHQYYLASDFFLNFNSDEIFGMSILEAMYQGCTVLACHAPGPDSIIENGISGYLVDTGADMKRIILSGVKLDKNNVRRRVTEKFSWEQTAWKFDGWIKQNSYSSRKADKGE